ncbi:prolyl aminopeptidase [Aeromicrobium massiliense]|uniref:prolyl aminopeptidase n=1 Tax=Aeromicrobium massiliense TaxID=1464554 RepID=UPI000578AB5E|nr:prolyl aminopeptidase [Aeromicrobium massiliense]
MRTPPLASGGLDVGDGHELHWEEHGNPDGVPAVALHGGPGSGIGQGWLRWFDLSRYRVLLLDQRGCGRSTPHAGRTTDALRANTTQHLVDDLERLRELRDVHRWVVLGASWGSTLGLAYAQAHPERVRALALFSVVTTTRREVAWVTRDMRRLFPREWEDFVGALPEAERHGDLAAAFHRLLVDPHPAVHQAAARAWCAWEDRHVSLSAVHDPRYDDPVFALGFARLVTHYWSHAAWLGETELLDGTARLHGVPGLLATGQGDVSGPPDVAHDLAARWPDAELVVVPDAGHGTGAALEAVVREAVSRFAALP